MNNENKNIFKIKKKPEYILTIYFGVPGSGKTTMAAYLAKRFKRGYNVWSNVPITGTKTRYKVRYR